MKSKGILLDTHILLWFPVGHARMPQSLIPVIQQAIRMREVYVSVMSHWELGTLCRKGKISLDVDNYWDLCLTHLKAKELNVDRDTSKIYHSLPASVHKDPGDRFLISHAIQHDLSLITIDNKIHECSSDLPIAIIGK